MERLAHCHVQVFGLVSRFAYGTRVLVCCSALCTLGCTSVQSGLPSDGGAGSAQRATGGSAAHGDMHHVATEAGTGGQAGGPAASAAAGAPSSADEAGSSEVSTADVPRDRFSVALSTSDCRGGCPTYDVKVNQNGMAEFNGRGNTRQQGMAVKLVSAEAVAEIRKAMDATNFWSLRDVYRDANDGCTEVDAESATYTWNVSTDGRAKIVIDYQGCKGVSELEALRKIPDMLVDKLSLGAWLGR